MKRRSFSMIVGAAMAACFLPSLALAENHLSEAITHTKEAIEHGKAGHADILVTHAKEGLKHAEAAEKRKQILIQKKVLRI